MWYWLFVKKSAYKIFSDEEVTFEVRQQLRREGWECIFDSYRSEEEAAAQVKKVFKAKEINPQKDTWYWLFVKRKTNQYIVYSEEELEMNSRRWILEDDGYEMVHDSLRSQKEAEQYAKEWYEASKLKLETRPITLKKASSFVNQHHRHHVSPQGHKFSIALSDGDETIGVVIAGRPVSRYQDDGTTLEVTRCCVKEVYKNGVSKLYAAVCQAAKAMGFKRVITYTLTEESGISMKASNFHLTRVSTGGSWNSKARQRVDKHPTGSKLLWTRELCC